MLMPILYKQRAKQRICQMLGHSDDCQPYALERGYDHVQNQLFAGEPTISGAALQEQLEQSRLLLQVDAVGNGMRFGRDGRLFFFIREADLKRKDFTKVWTMEQ